MSSYLFPSKILLTGEYTVLLNSSFLAMPFKLYSSQWVQTKNNPNNYLKAFISYLIDHCSDSIDTSLLSDQIQNGLRLKSGIPSGYGLGSSGALTAAIYDRYSCYPKNDIAQLREELSLIENYFHGSSSGIDPLVSYTQKVVTGQVAHIKYIEKLNLQYDTHNFFLLDSRKTRNTKNLVSLFKSKIKNKEYHRLIQEELIPLNDTLTKYIIQHDEMVITKIMKELSKFQLEHFSEMIPDSIKKIWMKGLSSDDYYIKLCGAGGGGYFLVWGDKSTVEYNPDKSNTLSIN